MSARETAGSEGSEGGHPEMSRDGHPETDSSGREEGEVSEPRATGADVHREGPIPGDELAPAYESIVFYIVAHQDDWQLFGGEHAFADLQRGDRKVVFIHTTAGDAGETSGYWEAREQGAIASARAGALAGRTSQGMAGRTSQGMAGCTSQGTAGRTSQRVERGGHPVVRIQCGCATLYFLRLPDGSPDGTGYEATGEQSLSRLRDSGAPIAAVDGSTTYGTWRDFVDTLAAIVAHERAGLEGAPVQFHAADPSPATNPGDHADHTATSEAVQEIARGLLFTPAEAPSPPATGESPPATPSVRHGITWWKTYCTDSLPPNLAGPPLAHKERLYRAYAAELERLTSLSGTPIVLGEGEWNLWGDRSYSRTES